MQRRVSRFRQPRFSSGRESFWRARRFSSSRSPWGRILVALALLGAIAAGSAWLLRERLSPRTPQTPPAAALEEVSAGQAAGPALPRSSLREGPASLQERLDAIAARHGEPIGIAVADVGAGWAVAVAGDHFFPQQSVSKTWVALAVLDAVDRGDLDLKSAVTMTFADRSVFNQPLGRSLSADGLEITIADLLHHALAFSDNSANDTLIRIVGLDAVRDVLARKGLDGIRMGSDERHLQALIAGLAWSPSYGEGRNFEQARAKLDRLHRRQALSAYLSDPIDGATPMGIVAALAALHSGELMSATSQAFLMETLAATRTGPARLKGGLPSGWKIAHKTGTGQDFEGGSVGINDIALLTAPDGRTYAVAVLMGFTRKPVRDRLAIMQSVSRAVSQQWATEIGD